MYIDIEFTINSNTCSTNQHHDQDCSQDESDLILNLRFDTQFTMISPSFSTKRRLFFFFLSCFAAFAVKNGTGSHMFRSESIPVNSWMHCGKNSSQNRRKWSTKNLKFSVLFKMFLGRRLLCALLILGGVAVADLGLYVFGFCHCQLIIWRITWTVHYHHQQRNLLFGARFSTDLFPSGWKTLTLLLLSLIVSSAILAFTFTNCINLLFPANLGQLIKQGILLDNYFATTHPSQPNYVAVVGGDNFGMDNDNLTEIPANVSTVVDLLESKGISWGEYQEGMPSTGFTGFDFLNTNGANKYVRKHKWVISTFRYPLSWHYFTVPWLITTLWPIFQNALRI